MDNNQQNNFQQNYGATMPVGNQPQQGYGATMPVGNQPQQGYGATMPAYGQSQQGYGATMPAYGQQYPQSIRSIAVSTNRIRTDTVSTTVRTAVFCADVKGCRKC